MGRKANKTDTLADALDGLDDVQQQLTEAGLSADQPGLAVARRVLRSHALLLSRASGYIRGLKPVPMTVVQLLRDIEAAVPELSDDKPGPDSVEEPDNPVPGPTPNAREDRVL